MNTAVENDLADRLRISTVELETISRRLSSKKAEFEQKNKLYSI